MAQYLRPNSDVTVNLFSPTPLYQQIDEVTRSDADLITSQANQAGLAEVGLSAGTDPQVSTGHILRYTLNRSITNKDYTMVVRLMQGTTTIASWTHANPSTTLTLFQQTLTGTQADAITDYSALSVQFDVTVAAGGGGTMSVSWCEFEIPDSAFLGTAAIDGSGDVAGTALVGAFGASAIAGEGTLAAEGAVVLYGAGALDGSGDLAGDGDAIGVGLSDLAGEGSLVGSGFTLALATGALDGSGDVAGDAFTVSFGAGSVAGEGVLAGEGVAVALGTADLDGSGDLAGTGLTDADYQYARPVSDVSSGGWVVTPLWSKVNEETENDSPLITSTDTTLCEIALGTVQVPDAGDVTIYVRAGKTTGAPADLRVRLVEGATVRAERLLDALTTSKVTYPLVLTTLERDAITNWGNLRIRLARE